MKVITTLTMVCLFGIFTTCHGQSMDRKKKFMLGLSVMMQNVTENTNEAITPFFEHEPINYEFQYRIGKIIKEKITTGIAIGFSTINYYDWESARFSETETEYYKSAGQLQLGVFANYKVYDEIFVDAYVGIFGLVQDGLLPRGDYENITRYNFSVGYNLHLWHFVALAPHISIRNRRTVFRGDANISTNYLNVGTNHANSVDDISIFSFGLGLLFEI